MPVYELSSRQKKELQERGAPLLLCFPAPPTVDEATDLRRWAQSMLPDQAALIDRCEIDEVISGPGGNHALGQLQAEWSDTNPCWCVPVVMVLLRPARPRNKQIGPQWPGNAGWTGEHSPRRSPGNRREYRELTSEEQRQVDDARRDAAKHRDAIIQEGRERRDK